MTAPFQTSRLTVLPIADRELRVAARSKATHRLRIAFALGAVLIAGALGLISLVSHGVFTAQLGIIVFNILKWMAFIFACGAGTFLTADCLSEEKREGTLGLIFLTDLRGHDVVLGKLFATSLRSFYSLLAIFPVLAFSFMLGGVTAEDFGHSLIAICNALFFSLALGMMISVVSRDSHKAMTGTLAAMCVILFLIPELDNLLPLRRGGGPWLGMLSPAYSFTNTTPLYPMDFWLSTIFVHLAGWGFLAVASWLAPRTWHDKRVPRETKRAWRFPLFDTAQSRESSRRLLEVSPPGWIIARDRWASNLTRLSLLLILVVFAASVVSYFQETSSATVPVAMTTISSSTRTNANGVTTGTVSYSTSMGMSNSWLFVLASGVASVFALALEFWLLSHLCRFYVDGKKNGFLELLLVTPVRPVDIIRGHWLALRRLFLAPVVALVGLNMVVGGIRVLELAANQSASSPTAALMGGSVWESQAVALVVGEIAWVTGLFALAWYAIWMGVASSKTSVAMLKAFLFVKVLPWIGVGFAMGLSAFFIAQLVGAGSLWLITVLPQVLMIGVNFVLIALARSNARAVFAKWPIS